MCEYAVSLMHEDGEGLILTSTITSNASIADVCLNSVKHDIKNGKYETGTSAILLMREVTSWREIAK